jgi:endonuclease YncB( thermonuclease family)
MLLLTAIALTLCPAGPHDNCVWDGDTFWLAGEKIRVADIDAPELHGQCSAETRQAHVARDRLLALLNSGSIELVRQGRDRDRYGRELRLVLVDGRDVGAMLISEGLARRWAGRRMPWCA